MFRFFLGGRSGKPCLNLNQIRYFCSKNTNVKPSFQDYRNLRLKDKPNKNVEKVIPPEPEPELEGPTRWQELKSDKKFRRGVIIYGALIFISFVGVGIYKFLDAMNNSTISTVYLGKNSDFDTQLNTSVGFPISEAATTFHEIFVKSEQFPNYLSLPKKLAIANKFLKNHENSILPQLLFAYIYWTENDVDKANEFIEKAHGIAKQFPENKDLQTLLPAKIIKSELNSKWNESSISRVNENIWTVNGYMEVAERKSPVELQSSIVRLEDNKLLLINPMEFNESIVKQIEELGTIEYIVTPCISHGKGIAKTSAIWPDAKLVGTDEILFHGRKNLPWRHLIRYNDSQFLQYDGIKVILLPGNLNREVLFYHSDSQTLIGPSDILLKNPLYSPSLQDGSTSLNSSLPSLEDVFHTVAFGLWRGKYTEPFVVPNSVVAWTNQADVLLEKIRSLSNLPIKTIVLGHGGIIHSPPDNFLKVQFSWLNFVDKYDWFKWFYHNNCLSLFLFGQFKNK